MNCKKCKGLIYEEDNGKSFCVDCNEPFKAQKTYPEYQKEYHKTYVNKNSKENSKRHYYKHRTKILTERNEKRQQAKF